MSIKVVQFLHSGKEYKLSEAEKEANSKFWNRDIIHRRKFLHAKGAYVDNSGKKIGDEKNWEDIYFWGEWEPESKVTSIFKKPIEGAKPHFINEPVVKIQSEHVVVPINKEDKNAHPVNTDPFVFGEDGFYYSCCMQSRYNKLQQLEPGSIILFGSNINHNTPDAYFALDTVFVVGPVENKQEYNKNTELNKLKEFGPKYYCDIMNFKASGNNSNCSGNGSASGGSCGSCGDSKNERFTSYRGASYDDPIKCGDDKMYSFVPCKIGKDGKKGFERVKLYDSDFECIGKKEIITNNQCQGVKYTEANNIQDNFIIWKELQKIIYQKDPEFKEAVRLDYTKE